MLKDWSRCYSTPAHQFTASYNQQNATDEVPDVITQSMHCAKGNAASKSQHL